MRGLLTLPSNRLTRVVALCGGLILLLTMVADDRVRILVRAISWGFMCVAGILRLARHPGPRQPFVLALLVAAAAFCVSNLDRFLSAAATTSSELTNSLGSVLILAAGMIFMHKARPDRRYELLLDGLIGGFAATILVREGLIMMGAEASVFGADAFFVIMVAVGASMWIRVLVRGTSRALLLFGVALAFALPAMAVVSLFGYGIARPVLVDVLTVLGVCALAMAVAHPRIHDAIQPLPSEIVPMTPVRAAGVALALLVLPVATVSRFVSDSSPDAVTVGTTVGVTVLFAARFTMLVRQRDRLRGVLVSRLNTDHLTGVGSRVYLLALLDSVVADRASGATGSAGLMFIDLDDFKAINDRHGHRSGDQVLAAVARRFEGVLEASDHLGRIAGDEFAILSIGRDEESMLELAMTVQRALNAPVLLDDGQVIPVSCAVGHTIVGHDDVGEAALDRADSAMYRSKVGDHRRSVDAVGDEVPA